MKKRVSLRGAITLFSWGLLFPCVTCAETDFDGDGVADVLSVAANGTNLRWQSVPSDGRSTALSTDFGLSGDLPVPAAWLTPGEPSLAVVRLNENSNNLTWKVLRPDGLITQKNFGKGGDYVVAGADFDGNGIADAAIMRIVRKRFVWTIKFDFFAEEEARPKRLVLGSLGQRILYLDPDGSHDWIGAIGTSGKSRALVTLRDPLSKARKRIKVPRSLATGPRPRPFPISSVTGEDSFGIATQDSSDTTVTIYDSAGTRGVRETFPGLATVVAADYDGNEEGDEILLATPSRMSIYNPYSQAKMDITPVSGTVIDTYRVQQIAGPAPTATPTVAPTTTIDPDATSD